MSRLLLVVLLGPLILFILGISASATCNIIQVSTSIGVEHLFDLSYISDQAEYWSSDCGRLKPACILIPKTTQEVAEIVKTLLITGDGFAVKSGGHNPNRFFSSIDGGPLISLKELNEVTYDPTTSTAKIGPGNRWTTVVETLQPYGVTVVGGRIGHVGVGGYILGGGLSYLSTQYGWAMDNVVEFEVVLANGTIVTATTDRNTDLFNVLRGGGNSFGIVTAYTLKTHTIGTIWGGNLIFTSDKTDVLLDAIRNFTENYPDDKAAIIATNEITLSSLANVWILFLFYDGASPPTGTFDIFLDLGPLLNTCKAQDYASFVSAEDDLVITGQIYAINTEMSPLPDASVGHEVMRSYYDHYYNTVLKNALVPGLAATMAWQPLPKRLAQHAKSQGGDLLDLDDEVDRILMEFDFSYQFPASNAQMNAATVELFSGIRDREQEFIKTGKLQDAYVPLFMNDANYQQDYWSRLRPEILTYAKSVKDKVDPGGFFSTRTGGFKMP